MSTSPTKYDGYSAYLSSINSQNTAFPSASTINEAAPLAETAADKTTPNVDPTPAVTPQKTSSERTTSNSPPFTPSTPPPPPPVPAGGMPPLLKPSGSFADAVKPLRGSPSVDVHKGVDGSGASATGTSLLSIYICLYSACISTSHHF
jgi:hypothetical protein